MNGRRVTGHIDELTEWTDKTEYQLHGCCYIVGILEMSHTLQLCKFISVREVV